MLPLSDDTLVDRTILIAGSPRSGTTWLAKLLDSHPDVLYRHEPDELSPPIPGADPRFQLQKWIHERRLRVSAKPPFFRKSWRPQPFALAWTALVAGLKGASRLGRLGSIAATMPIPDITLTGKIASLRPAIKLVNWDISEVARGIPQCRALFILRHPCGQVQSTLQGVAQQYFEANSVIGDTASTYAASHGIDASAFDELPLSAKYAWMWRSFNEPILGRCADLPNVHILQYEDLCDDPADMTHDLFDFVGLDWNPQTEQFIARSSQDDSDGDYYAVFRTSGAVARRWRSTMTVGDQQAVREVVSTSPLVHYWPELAE